MAGSVSGTATTYGLPNYGGELIALTPDDTAFMSALGGLTGGKSVTSKEWEWETYDLATPGQNVQLEGADAPTATERVRANVTNVVEIHQGTVAVSYTKLAAYGEKAGVINMQPNPVTNELDWQLDKKLKEMKRDVNYSLINGVYQKPTDNSTARQTRGLLAAITSNAMSAEGVAISGVWEADDEVITAAAHGLAVGDRVRIDVLTGSTGQVDGYFYVRTVPSSSTFTVSATKGGAVAAITVDGTANIYKQDALTVSLLGDAMQSAYDNGGLTEQSTTTILCNSQGKRQISNMYGEAYGKFQETSRTMGGVNVDTILTDFGRAAVMLDRQMPQGTLAIVSMDQCDLVFLEVPGKGHFFAEPLAKVGASDKVMLYGEIGLEYGNQAAHAKITGMYF